MTRAAWSLAAAAGLTVTLAASHAGADVTRAQCAESYERGQTLRRDTRLREAREALLLCSQKECPAVTTTDCARWLAEVDALVPTVAIAVRDPAGSDVRAAITIDGAAQASGRAGQPIAMDPGSHHLRAETGDGRRSELDIVARAGEQNRLVTLVVGGPAPADAAAPVAPPPSTAASTSSTSRSFVLPLAVTSAGVLGVGAAVFFGLRATSEADDLRASACAPRCPEASLDGVHRSLLLSDVGLGVGIVGLAVGTYLWVRFVSHGSHDQATSAALSPSSSRGGSVASAALRF